MKKLSFIVAMALAVVANYSCGEQDNSVDNNGKTTITDANGKPYEVGDVGTLIAEPGRLVTVRIKLYEGEDYYALKSGDNIKTALVNDQEYVAIEDFPVAEDGVIQLLGNKEIHSLGILGATPAYLDSEKLSRLVALGIADVKLEDFKLEKQETLDTLAIINCGLESIDLGDNTSLKYLDLKINNLTSIDLKKCYKLEYVDLGLNQLTNIELSNEYANLTLFDAEYNNLTTFDPSKMRHLKELYLSSNNLQGEIDLTPCLDLESVNLENNELTNVKIGNVKKGLNISNNKLGFGNMPLPSIFADEVFYCYAPQKDIDVSITNGILDMSEQYVIDGNFTTFDFDPEDTEVDFMENGQIAFPTDVNNVVITMTNASFPGLTLKTVPFSTAAASNVLYSFEPAIDNFANGGEISYIHTNTGTAADDIDYLHYFDEINTKNWYTTILVNGTRENLCAAPYHYVRVDLNEPLKKGNIIRFTGFRNTQPDEASNLLLLFDLLNNDEERTYKTYKPGDDDTFEYAFTEMFSNIWETGLKPDKTIQLIVDEAIIGSKSFKIVLNDHVTDSYLTKIEVLRKAE